MGPGTPSVVVIKISFRMNFPIHLTERFSTGSLLHLWCLTLCFLFDVCGLSCHIENPDLSSVGEKKRQKQSRWTRCQTVRIVVPIIHTSVGFWFLILRIYLPRSILNGTKFKIWRGNVLLGHHTWLYISIFCTSHISHWRTRLFGHAHCWWTRTRKISWLFSFLLINGVYVLLCLVRLTSQSNKAHDTLSSLEIHNLCDPSSFSWSQIWQNASIQTIRYCGIFHVPGHFRTLPSLPH